jgi:hypothetical protein
MPVGFVGASNLIATNGTAPGAITPHASTVNGNLLLWFHYSRATGGNETVVFPAGWNQVFNSVTANNGLVAMAWRNRTAGDTTYTATVTNHTTGTSGETILEWIETYSGHDPVNPIVNFTASLSTWASSTTLGSIVAPASPTVHPGDMAVVFAGRFENISAQTTLTGDNLTWAQGTRNDTTQGTDAGAVTQRGLNSSGSNQTLTAKSITTTGTAQAGAGRMFIIEVAGTSPITGTSDGTSTASAILTGRGSVSGSSAGSTTSTGELTGKGSISGTSDGVAIGSAVITGRGTLSGLSEGSSTANAEFTPLGGISGSGAGTSSATAELTGRGSLEGQAEGSSIVSSTLTGRGQLSGSCVCTSVAAGIISGYGTIHLIGAAMGSSTAHGELRNASAPASDKKRKEMSILTLRMMMRK